MKLDLSKATVVQDCDNGTGIPVVQDYTCSTKLLAAGAIDDAITMVQAVKGVWNHTLYLPILQRYMGSTIGYGPGDYQSCQTPEASSWISGKYPKPMAECKYSLRTATLEDLAEVQENQWLPYDLR